MMVEKRREVEAQGQDVESAIEAGLRSLGVELEDVIVDVIDEGSRGLLGIGSRDAVVRLTMLAEQETAEMEEDAPTSPPRADISAETLPAEEVDSEGTDAGIEELVETAVQMLEQLLSKMQIVAHVGTRLSEPDDLTGRQILVLDVKGNDLGMLIGPRGETLNAIQHISRLMVGHQMQQRVDFVVDIQGYRQRREKALARLAERMAMKVSGQRRPISLEPMPPHERRIIHMTLRDDAQVYTQSTGEGSRRRVRILPKGRD